MKPEWKNYAIGALAMAALFVVGLLVYPRSETVQQPSGEQPDTSSREIAEAIQAGRIKLQQTLGEQLADMKAQIEQMEQKIASFEQPELLEQADVPPVEPPETSETAGTDLEDILAAIRGVGRDDVPLKVALPPEEQPAPEDTPVEEAAQEELNLETPDVPQPQRHREPRTAKGLNFEAPDVPQPETDEGEIQLPEETGEGEAPDDAALLEEPQPEEDIDKTFAELEAEANKLADDLEFETALAILDSRPDITDTAYQVKRERAKKSIRLKAETEFQADMAQAEELAKQGRCEEAAEIYDSITRYGLPSMITEARRQSASLPVEVAETEPEVETVSETETETVKPRETIEPSDSDDPRIARYIAQLRDKSAAQHLRTQAAKELGILKATAGIPDLIKALDDRDWLLRIRAATSLAEMGDTRAVPALIRNLEHPMLPVRPAARQALEKITGQEFGDDVQAWEDWWKAESGAEDTAHEDGDSEAADDEQEKTQYEPPEELDSFVSQIIILRPADNALVFELREGVHVGVGQKLNLLREGKKIAEVQVAVSGFGNATAKILSRTEDPLEEGDMVVVEKVAAENDAP